MSYLWANEILDRFFSLPCLSAKNSKNHIICYIYYVTLNIICWIPCTDPARTYQTRLLSYDHANSSPYECTNYTTEKTSTVNNYHWENEFSDMCLSIPEEELSLFCKVWSVGLSGDVLKNDSEKGIIRSYSCLKVTVVCI